MKRLTLGLLGLGLCGLLVSVAPDAPAKEKDPAKIHAKKVAKYETKKGGKLFGDDSFYVDLEKIDDSRWAIDGAKSQKLNDVQSVELRGSYTPAPGQPPAISITIQKYLHKKGGKTVPMSFGNCGEKADTSDPKNMTRLKCLDDRKVSTEVREKECVEIDKAKGYGEAKYRAVLVAVSPHSKQKQRTEYYGWASKDATYIAECAVSGPVLQNEKQLESMIGKVKTFLSNVKEAK